jgi:hypothetical protein
MRRGLEGLAGPNPAGSGHKRLRAEAPDERLGAREIGLAGRQQEAKNALIEFLPINRQ